MVDCTFAPALYTSLTQRAEFEARLHCLEAERERLEGELPERPHSPDRARSATPTRRRPWDARPRPPLADAAGTRPRGDSAASEGGAAAAAPRSASSRATLRAGAPPPTARRTSSYSRAPRGRFAAALRRREAASRSSSPDALPRSPSPPLPDGGSPVMPPRRHHSAPGAGPQRFASAPVLVARPPTPTGALPASPPRGSGAVAVWGGIGPATYVAHSAHGSTERPRPPALGQLPYARPGCGGFAAPPPPCRILPPAVLVASAPGTPRSQVQPERAFQRPLPTWQATGASPNMGASRCLLGAPGSGSVPMPPAGGHPPPAAQVPLPSPAHFVRAGSAVPSSAGPGTPVVPQPAVVGTPVVPVQVVLAASPAALTPRPPVAHGSIWTGPSGGIAQPAACSLTVGVSIPQWAAPTPRAAPTLLADRRTHMGVPPSLVLGPPAVATPDKALYVAHELGQLKCLPWPIRSVGC